MIIADAENLQQAIDADDLVYIDKLITPQKREINKTSAFRSPLMLSAHKIKHLNKIPELKTDAIILNLEDGVSAEMKPFGLRLCMMTLSALKTSDKKIIVRVNALDESGAEEIKALNAFYPDAIRIPKIKTVHDVERALELIDKEIEVHLSIETKEAWLNLSTLKIDERVKAYYLGILDLFADMGFSQELIRVDNPLIHQVLAQFILTAKASGVKPVSFVFQEYEDHQAFQAWLALEKEMGYDAKGCLSPKQVEQVQAAYAPDAQALQRAKYIIKRFEEQRSRGITGFSDDNYGFIDEPIYKGALALLKG